MGAAPDLDPQLRPTLHALGMMYGALGLPLNELAAEHRPKRGLSPREKECLLWAARGKSDWDIGMILGLSFLIIMIGQIGGPVIDTLDDRVSSAVWVRVWPPVRGEKAI